MKLYYNFSTINTVRNIVSVVMVLGFLFPSALSGQNIIWVSPQGDDAWTGKSIEKPFHTLQRTLAEIREIKKSGLLSSQIKILLRGGHYYLSDPLVLTPDDSGTENAPVLFTAFQNEKPVINGGKIIKDWKKGKKGIWYAEVDQDLDFRQMYINGKLRHRARTPNNGFFRVQGFPDGSYPDVPWHTASKSFIFSGKDINPHWRNLNDAEVIVYHFWTDVHLSIQDINEKTHTVTFKNPATKVFNDDFSTEGARYIIENTFEGLDTAGEWYLDKKKHKLFYMPKKDEDMNTAEVIVPVLPAFIHFEGDALHNKYVKNIHFSGLTFQYNNWVMPPGYTNDGQASSGIPAAISMTGTKNCTVSSCVIQKIGTYAVDISKGCSNIEFSHNRFSHLAAGGFRINGGTEKDNPLTRTFRNTISDNYIENYGEDFSSAVGILLMNAFENTISHNEISEGYYTGISVGWQWGYQHSISWNNVLEYNYIHNIGHGLLSDMGAIYTLGVSPGTIIRNNLIHDIESHNYGGWGIYNDEGSTHILVENNVVYNTKFSPYDIHYSREIWVRNNIFALGRKDQLSRTRIDPHKSVFFENNIIYWKKGKLFSGNWKDSPYVFHFKPGDMGPDANRKVSSTFEIDWNVYFNPLMPVDSVDFAGNSFEQWKAAGKDIHSVYSDPKFVDPDHYNFSLKPDSPALMLGFYPIDLSAVGPRSK